MTETTNKFTIKSTIAFVFIIIGFATIFIFIAYWKYQKLIFNQLKKGFFNTKLPLILDNLTKKHDELKSHE